jgi:hypothetical protein
MQGKITEYKIILKLLCTENYVISNMYFLRYNRIHQFSKYAI